MTDDIENTPTPETTNQQAPEPLTALQRLMIAHGRRPTPNSDADTDTAPPVPALTQGVDNARAIDLPDNLTAASIVKMTESLDPAHPAAQLSTMNADLLSLMVAEDDQTRLLRRQAQTLDTLFHTMLNFGFTPPTKKKTTRGRKNKPDKDSLSVALQSQRQCFDIVKNLNATEYTNALAQHLLSKLESRSRTHDTRFENAVRDFAGDNHADTPLPQISGEQNE